MTSIVDSEAQFDLRMEQVRLPVVLRQALKNSGVNTISALAYSYGQPGQQIVPEDFQAWVRQLDPSATIGGVSALKRLFFESQTQLLAILKEQITNPEPTAARKVPHAERDARMTNLKARLNGVLIEEHCEPSHSLLDLATQLYDQNILRFIPLEKCFSRLTELSFSNKAQTKLLEIESSKVVIKEKDADFESAVQFSYQALEAFKRRGLALEFAGVMSYTAHDQYVQMLFSHLNREPPVGYNRVSVSQLLSADKAAWSSLIEKNLKPRPDAAGVLPLNASLEDALKAYEVSFTLLPMVSKAQPKASPAPPQSTRPPAAAPFSKGHHKGQFRPKPYGTKGKGKSKSKFEQRIPQQIRDAGGTASTPDGDPICFDYSLKRCKEQVTDGRCRKGYHVCCLCYGQHCMLDHKKS